MSTTKPSAKSKPKQGSAFKMPGSRTASTPATKNDTNVTIGCDLSMIPPGTTVTQRTRHRPLPGTKVSTPTKEEKDIPLACDISAIRPSTVSAQQRFHQPVLNAKKALYKSGNDSLVPGAASSKILKQAEVDMAYNDYLLAITHNTIQKRHYADTKAQIEADLGALTKRLSVNLLNLETTKQRISEVSFLSERDRLLTAQTDSVTNTLGHVEGDAGKTISAMSAAVDAKADNLEMRNIATGTAELKQILEDSNRILSKLKACDPTGDTTRTTTAADCLKDTAATMKVVNARHERVTKKLPAYQGAAIIEQTIQTFNSEQEENGWILEDDYNGLQIDTQLNTHNS